MKNSKECLNKVIAKFIVVIFGMTTISCTKTIDRFVEVIKEVPGSTTQLNDEGVIDSSGGNAKESTVEEVKSAIQSGFLKIPNVIHRLKLMYELNDSGISNIVTNFIDRKPEEKLKSLTIKPQEEACDSREGHRDSSVNQANEICLSTSRLQRIPPSSLETEIIALLVHEISHVVVFNENDADMIQEHIVENPNRYNFTDNAFIKFTKDFDQLKGDIIYALIGMLQNEVNYYNFCSQASEIKGFAKALGGRYAVWGFNTPPISLTGEIAKKFRNVLYLGDSMSLLLYAVNSGDTSKLESIDMNSIKLDECQTNRHFSEMVNHLRHEKTMRRNLIEGLVGYYRAISQVFREIEESLYINPNPHNLDDALASSVLFEASIKSDMIKNKVLTPIEKKFASCNLTVNGISTNIDLSFNFKRIYVNGDIVSDKSVSRSRKGNYVIIHQYWYGYETSSHTLVKPIWNDVKRPEGVLSVQSVTGGAIVGSQKYDESSHSIGLYVENSVSESAGAKFQFKDEGKTIDIELNCEINNE